MILFYSPSLSGSLLVKVPFSRWRNYLFARCAQMMRAQTERRAAAEISLMRVLWTAL